MVRFICIALFAALAACAPKPAPDVIVGSEGTDVLRDDSQHDRLEDGLTVP